MERENVLNALRRLRTALEARGIAHIGVFGSVARGESGARIDIDIVATPAHGARLDLFDLGGVQTLLDETFAGRDIDLVIEPVRRPDLLSAIERDRVHAF